MSISKSLERIIFAPFLHLLGVPILSIQNVNSIGSNSKNETVVVLHSNFVETVGVGFPHTGGVVELGGEALENRRENML